MSCIPLPEKFRNPLRAGSHIPVFYAELLASVNQSTQHPYEALIKYYLTHLPDHDEVRSCYDQVIKYLCTNFPKYYNVINLNTEKYCDCTHPCDYQTIKKLKLALEEQQTHVY